MVPTLILLGALVALPREVEQAEGWPAPDRHRIRLSSSPPQLLRVRVSGRSKKLREWRNPSQDYAIFGSPRGYYALQIRLGRYEILAGELESHSAAKRHRTFSDANHAINVDFVARRSN
jgi:hypothetical protein